MGCDVLECNEVQHSVSVAARQGDIDATHRGRSLSADVCLLLKYLLAQQKLTD